MSGDTSDVTLEITTDPERRFGHACLVLSGIAALPDGRFHLRRLDQEPTELGPHGWQNGTVLLQADAVRREGDRAVLRVGPAVVDMIAVDTPVELELPATGLRLQTWWPDIPPSLGRGSGGQIVRPIPSPAKATVIVENAAAPQLHIEEPPPRVEPVETAAEAGTGGAETDETETGEPDKRPRRWPRLAAVAAVCLFVGAGYMFVNPCGLARLGVAIEGCAEPVGPTEPSGQPALQPVPAVGNPAERLEALLVRDPPASGEELFALGWEAWDGGDQIAGFDAVQEAVALGYGPALALFARWYDPRYHATEGSPFSGPDAAAAIDYYGRAASAGTTEAGSELEGLCAYLRTEDGSTPLPSACAP